MYYIQRFGERRGRVDVTTRPALPLRADTAGSWQAAAPRGILVSWLMRWSGGTFLTSPWSARCVIRCTSAAGSLPGRWSAPGQTAATRITGPGRGSPPPAIRAAAYTVVPYTTADLGQSAPQAGLCTKILQSAMLARRGRVCRPPHGPPVGCRPRRVRRWRGGGEPWASTSSCTCLSGHPGCARRSSATNSPTSANPT